MHMNNNWIIELLEDVSEFLEPQIDVRDGSDGKQLPNAAMSLSIRVDQAIRIFRGRAGQ